MQQLSGLDASFMYFETPTTPMHVGGCSIYDPSTVPGGGKVRFKDIIRHVEQRLGQSRTFRQRAVTVPFNLDHPYWIEDPDFDIEFHIRHIALPEPGDWRQLCIQVARLHSRQMDLTKPQWEMTVIEGLDNIPGLPKGSFAVVTKMHHAAVDGVSGMEIITVLHDTRPDAPPPEPKPWTPEKIPSPADLLTRAHIHNLQQPLRFAQALSKAVPGLAKLAQQLTAGTVRMPATGARPAPRTRFNGKVTAHRVVEALEFPLADFKAFRNAVPGVTINDGVMAVVGGGLRKYLKSKDDLPAESLVAMAPISVRSESEKGTAGNSVSAMLVAIGTHIDDPLARLKFVHEEAVNSKGLTNAVGARNLSEFSQFIPGALAGLGARLATQFEMTDQGAAINTVITNVPGPQDPLYFAGARMVSTFGLGPVAPGMGLIHPITSYCGKMVIAVTSDRTIMPDPGFYAQCIKDSFAEMKAAADKAAAAAA